MAGSKLQDVKIAKAKAKDKAYKLTDGHGLYLYVTPAGGKYWRWKYYVDKRERLLSLGEYPSLSLSAAREKHQSLRRVLASGVDPATVQQQQIVRVPAPPVTDAPKLQIEYPASSFGAVQQEWFRTWSANNDPDYVKQMESRLAADVMPYLGARPVTEIEAPDVVTVVKAIEARGANELARKALRTIGQVFRYGIAHGYARRNPAMDIKPSDIFRRVEVHNHPRVHQRDLPQLLLDIEMYTGRELTKAAMRIMAHTFLRTTELTLTPWIEIDFDSARWEIPADRMKKPSPHIVPLSRQVIAELRRIKAMTRNEEHVFPGDWERNEHMSTGAISGALKRMGYRGEMTGHGFRGVASTILHEMGYDDAHIETQLAHLKRNKVSAAYDYAKYLEPRAKMMQAWSDYLDKQLGSALSRQ